MQYMLMIYDHEKAWPAMAEGERNADHRRVHGAHEGTEGHGHFIAGDALQPTTTATTVRVRDGKTRYDRRPVRGDQGAARRLLPHRGEGPRRGAPRSRRASRGARFGSIEVRPIMSDVDALSVDA